MRRTTSGSNLAAVPVGVVLNGQTIQLQATTEGTFFTSAGDFGLRDPTAVPNSVGGTNGKITMEFLLYDTAIAAQVLYQHTGPMTLEILSTGALRYSVRDSAGTALASLVATAAGLFTANTLHRILFSVDLAAQTAKLWLNGTLVSETALGANTGAFRTADTIMNLLQTTAAGSRYSGRVYGVKIWKDAVSLEGENPVATPYFDCPVTAAGVNASAWKNGAGVAT